MISYKEYKRLFKQDEDGSFLNLIIPKSVDGDELNLVGKHPRDFTLGEIVRMKKYSADMFELADKNTIGDE
jgi:hypothetical protein